MVTNMKLGESLVGAYHKIITECQVVSYNQRSPQQGKQLEVDVVGIYTENGSQTIYVAEVLTHLDGTPYSGTPDDDRWAEFGGDKYQFTLQKLWNKFTDDYDHVLDVFDDADEYIFEFWSPVLPEGMLTEGLDQLSADFEAETGCELRIIVNEDYAECIGELRDAAGAETKGSNSPAYRFLQILEHMKT